MNLPPPGSQKADVRPISFLLVDQNSSADAISPSRSVTLYVRPEELTRTDPSRINPQQTLGGTAWADNFGPGIAAIQISGNTGWRRSAGDIQIDGEERFRELKNQVFNSWHERRIEAMNAGNDPDRVQLVFADALDGFAVVVAPLSFTLRRSRSRPLLLQYQISMTVLDENIDQRIAYPRSTPGSIADVQSSGLDSMLASINEIATYARDIQNYIDRTLAAPVANFMNQTGRVYRAVHDAISAGDAVAESLISVARMSAQAGLNIFRTAAAIANIPSHARMRLMEVAGAYTNVFCILRNAVDQQLFYPDYSPLFGASNCSSTSGGRPPSPLSGVNPFYYVNPTPGSPPVQITNEAQQSMLQLAASDIILSTLSVPQLRASVTTITEGLSVPS